MMSMLQAPFPLLLLKATLVFGVGLAIAGRRQVAPVLRHTILLATVCAALALPLLSLVTPRWNAPVLPSATREVTTARDAAIMPAYTAGLITPGIRADRQTREHEDARPAASVEPGASADRVASDTSKPTGFDTLLALVLACLWPLGTLALLTRLAVGHLRLRMIGRNAWHADSAEWGSLLAEECALAGVSGKVRLLVSPAASTPLTWGTRHPVVLLPEDALEWSDSHRRIVLRHELAHVARRDAFAQSIAGVACALYWFHPLAALTARRLRTECERACDDRVVALGTRASDYASHLLDVARAAREIGAPGLLSLAMARPSQLEGRLLSVLDSSRTLRKPSRGARMLAVVFPLSVALAGSAFHPVARQPRTEHRALARHEADTVRSVRTVQTSLLPVVAAATVTVPVVTTTVALDSAFVTRAEQDATFDRSVAVRPGGTLRIELRFTGGSVTVTGWDEDRVEVRGRLGGRDWRDTEVSLEETRDGAELRTDFRGNTRNANFSHTFDIRVPRRFNVVLTSAGGGIRLRDMRGRFTGSTGGGDIDADRLNGEMRLSTGGGNVLVTNSELDGTVSTGGGDVRMRSVTGDLRGSSGSGNATIDMPSRRTSVDEVRERDRDQIRERAVTSERDRVIEETRRRAIDRERERALDRDRDRANDRERDRAIERVRERQLDRERDNVVRARTDSVLSRVLGRGSRFDSATTDRYSDGVVMRRDSVTNEVRMDGRSVINTTSFRDDDWVRRFSNFGRGGIFYNRAGGAITIDEAPRGARVSTGGGAIRIGPSSGEVYASTGGGDVTIGPARGSVVATTGAGNVTVRFEGGGAHSADVISGYGRAVLTLPSDISATLVLETAYTENRRATRIDNDFGGSVTETPEYSDREGTPRRYVRSRVRLGRGEGIINVRVVNGDIEIRRAGDSR